jgi:hypothetical protein
MDTQRAIEKLLQNFTKELMKVFSESVVRAVAQVGSTRASVPASPAPAPAARRARPEGKAAAPKARPAKPGRPAGPRKGGKVDKSSPAEVDSLCDEIIAALRRAERNLAAREIMERIGLKSLDAGRFNYALGKLKDDGRVAQHGDRRMARYGLGNDAKAKAKAPRKAKAADADEAVDAAASETAPAEG